MLSFQCLEAGPKESTQKFINVCYKLLPKLQAFLSVVQYNFSIEVISLHYSVEISNYTLKWKIITLGIMHYVHISITTDNKACFV